MFYEVRILLPIPPPKHVSLWEAPRFDCFLWFRPRRTHSSTRCRLPCVIQTLVFPNREQFSVLLPPRIFLSMPPPGHVPFWEGPAPEENALGFRITFEAQGLGAHVARRARTAPLRPKSTLLTRTPSFVSLRHKSRGNPTSRTGLRCG